MRKGGRVSVVGVFAGTANHVHLDAFMEKGLTLRGSQAPVQRYWRTLALEVARRALDPSVVVTHRLSLDEAAKGFRIFDEKSDGCVKVVFGRGRRRERRERRARAGAQGAGARRAKRQEEVPPPASSAAAAEGAAEEGGGGGGVITGESEEAVQGVPVVALT